MLQKTLPFNNNTRGPLEMVAKLDQNVHCIQITIVHYSSYQKYAIINQGVQEVQEFNSLENRRLIRSGSNSFSVHVCTFLL